MSAPVLLEAPILLEARGLEIRFGGVVAADGVDIAIHQGRNLAIIGPNGAGKTTFLNICTGYLKPSAGSVHFDGRGDHAEVARGRSPAWASRAPSRCRSSSTSTPRSRTC